MPSKCEIRIAISSSLNSSSASATDAALWSSILGYIPGIIYALYSIVFVDRNDYFDEYRRPLYYG